MIRSKILFALLGLTIIVEAQAVYSQETLMIDPKRVVFENAKRTDIVTMYNSSNDTINYLIGYKHFEMLENGTLKEIDSAKASMLLADSLIRFFPRGVKLKPRSSQALRLQFMKPKGLASGEYRTHICIVEAESKKAIGSPSSDTDKTISLSIHARIALAIPIIARYQTKGVKVTLGNLHLHDEDTAGMRKVTFQMNREGDESCYGNLTLTYRAPDGKETMLSEMKGTGIYSTLNRRFYTMTFKPPPSLKIEMSGTLNLEYRRADASKKEAALAILDVPITR